MTTLPRQLNWTTAATAVLLPVMLGSSAAAGSPKKAEPQAALAKLAASVNAGQWAELKTSGLNMKVFSDGGNHALQYTDEAVRDPGSRQLFFCGEGHGAAPRLVKYTETANHQEGI